MLECIVEAGYRDTTVADIVRVARTSRRSFYQEFADKQSCFFALLTVTNEFMIAEIATRRWEGVHRRAGATSGVVICCSE